jgi:branched-subunit amino acid transport protein
MSWALVLGLAALTYGSRALALVLLPEPGPRLRRVLDRMPAPMFAGLAIVSLVGSEAGPAPARVWIAAAGAMAASPARSLLVALGGGLAGYVVGGWVT